MKNTLPINLKVAGLMKISSCAAALLASLLAFAPTVSVPAQATDMAPAATSEGSSSRFVRIGLDKSIVIHLPGDAKDVVVGNPPVSCS